MKKTYKIVSIIIALVCATSFTACKKVEGGQPKQEELVKATYQGTHVLNAPVTDSDLIKDGSTEYKLVIAQNASAYVKSAQDEFVHLFKKATEIIIPAVRDSNLEDGVKYISIGDTKLAQDNGVTYDKSVLTDYGVRIITKNNNIYLFSGADTGINNSVYTFMRIYFNYEHYYRNCTVIDKGVKNAKLRNFDVTDIPDIPMRIGESRYYESQYEPLTVTDIATGTTVQDTKNRALRLGFTRDNMSKYLLPIVSTTDSGETIKLGYHNVVRGFAPKHLDYSSYFPDGDNRSTKWYSDGGDQICFNAQGDLVAYLALIQRCVDKITESLVLHTPAQYPEYKFAGIFIEDGPPMCGCDVCQAKTIEDGGAPIGSVIRFSNIVRRAVQIWMDNPLNAEYRREELTLLFFAYADHVRPAAEKNSSGEWVPVNDSVVMDDNVGVLYACANDASYLRGIYEKENDFHRENLLGWSAVSDHLYLWTYGIFYRNALYYNDSLSYFDNDTIALYASCGVKSVFNEAIDYGIDATGFQALKDYLLGKLLWDCNVDIEQLTENFMKNMYHDVADEMAELLLDIRSYYSTMMRKHGLDGPHTQYKVPKTEGSFKFKVFEKWINMAEDAIVKAEQIKARDENLFIAVKSRIGLEQIAPLSCCLDLYGQDTSVLDQTTKNFYKSRLVSILEEYYDVNYVGHTQRPILNMVGGW